MNLKEIFSKLYSNKISRSVLGVLIGAALLWWIFQPKPVQVSIGKVERGTYEHIVEEEGTTRVKEKFAILSPVNGVLQRVSKHVGDKVHKGETVAVVHWDYDRIVKSPISGSILSVQRESEGPISMGGQILEIGDTTSLEIVCDVLTQESTHIRPGNQVWIEGWGGNPIEGKVRLVEPAAFTKISSLGVEEQRVRTIIDFNSPSEMGDSYRIQAQIISFKKDNVLILPTAALFREGDHWSVFQVVKGKVHKTNVVIEARSGKSSLVTSGLGEGEEVVLYPTEEIQEGKKVR
ncbi:HlyD family efflux transporter periplasmic adaptor subunit [Leptospira langatensis]|uniref:HlyD family efflux transporter periplasmic adaptor subunit n=1 Tax=Leptospira langatensis TaxID=2484983 RepID=A0A5F1ZVC8_9LEPT|nr:HlyD family efflux transporter periplasmic adaptor subunit [Leptospira langatensis]TGK01326.1 HlyD family efflux transporter periplasmic adaptor subunit [Leptospira langatensis]TGL42222.1 HlyD family efflux transporter periplasmic adaptor subunit [Leptospira langatensis]